MLSQVTAITGLNFKSIPERWASSLVIVVGLAGVVAVFTALLAMATGFEKTLAATGRTDNAIVLNVKHYEVRAPGQKTGTVFLDSAKARPMTAMS